MFALKTISSHGIRSTALIVLCLNLSLLRAEQPQVEKHAAIPGASARAARYSWFLRADNVQQELMVTETQKKQLETIREEY